MYSSECSISTSHYHHHRLHHYAAEFTYWGTEPGDGGGGARIVGTGVVNQHRAELKDAIF